MKRRILAAGLAAATALSLSVAPAQAVENKTSSEISDSELKSYLLEQARNGNVTALMEQIARKEHQKPGDDSPAAQALYSSLRNDAANGYASGKTLNILLGTGITALILGGLGNFAVQQGLVQLPKLPF